MKNLILFVLVFALLPLKEALGQQTVRIGYVDMEYILENVPEYQEASEQLEKKVQQWKQEIETDLAEIEELKKQLKNEKPLLTAELIAEREEEIRFLEQKVLDYQQKRFGPRGDLMTQKLQLVKPVQNQVFVAVQEIAKNRDYDLIFDKSAGLVTLFAAERLDVSDQVLRLIKRASRREELESRDEKQELVREESRSLEEDAEVSKREKLRQQREQKREALLEQRRRERDSLKAARKAAYEKRRAEILQERQRKKDSLEKAREESRDL